MPTSKRPLNHTAWTRWMMILIGLCGSIALSTLIAPWLQHALGETWGLVAALTIVAIFSTAILVLLLRRLSSVTPQSPVTSLLETTTRELPRIRQRRRLLRLITRALVRGFRASHATVFLEDQTTTTYWLAER